MLAFAIVWLTLATGVVVLATLRKAAAQQGEPVRVHDTKVPRHESHLEATSRWLEYSGKAGTLVAMLYGLALLVGFFYIGWQNTLQLK